MIHTRFHSFTESQNNFAASLSGRTADAERMQKMSASFIRREGTWTNTGVRTNKIETGHSTQNSTTVKLLRFLRRQGKPLTGGRRFLRVSTRSTGRPDDTRQARTPSGRPIPEIRTIRADDPHPVTLVRTVPGSAGAFIFRNVRTSGLWERKNRL